MKEIMKMILGIICLMSLFLACAEAETIEAQLIWSLSMLAICAVSGWGASKLMTKEELEEEV